MIRPVVLAVLALLLPPARLMADEPLAGVHRVVFLGDSITYSGPYIAFLEAVLKVQNPDLRCEFLNLGLPSETVSGLTEPGHAGGQFPRPDLRERLDRVLTRARPDLIVACYGMNDGIYSPFSEERFARFREGMRSLHDRARSVGIRILHVTPPVFDPVPIRGKTLPANRGAYPQPYEGYDEVLNLYAAWLLAERGNGWDVVDIHGPLRTALSQGRSLDPDFRLAADGVHLDDFGHNVIGRAIARHWGVSPDEYSQVAARAKFPSVLDQVKTKQRLLKDAWLTATGHTRPGMAPGVPLADAEKQAAKIDAEIREILAAGP